MTTSTTRLMASAAICALAAATPMMLHAQTSEPETTTAPAEETRLTCQAEVAALRDTIRSEDEYTSIAPRFEELIAAADDAAVNQGDGVCYIRLLGAQQFLAQSGLGVEGYSDQATIYRTIEAAQAAGALSDQDVGAARAATVEVEARPARVAVTPQAAQVAIEQDATQVNVAQRPAQIVVEQAPANVDVQQSQPNIDVTQAPADVAVDAPAPEVEVIQPEPRIRVTQAQPEIAVTQTPPQVRVTQDEPKVTIRQFEPQVEIIQPQPRITVNQAEPEVAVVQPQPEVTVTPAQPIVTVGQAQPDVTVDYDAPEVNVTQRAPEVQVEAAEPTVSVAEAQPQVSVSQGEPTIEVAQAEPIVNVEQAQPQVDVTQEQAVVTAEMAEAEVTIDTAEGADVDTIDSGSADVSVELVGEPQIEITAEDADRAIAAVEPIAIEEVEFAFDSDVVTDVGRSNIADAVDLIDADSRAILIGYASPIGNAAYNLDLSQRRVENVRDAMVEMGVDPSQIVVRSLGENDAETEATENERSEENRRVEIRILPAAAFTGN